MQKKFKPGDPVLIDGAAAFVDGQDVEARVLDIKENGYLLCVCVDTQSRVYVHRRHCALIPLDMQVSER